MEQIWAFTVPCKHCGELFRSEYPLQLKEVARTLYEAAAHHLELHGDEFVSNVLNDTANNLLERYVEE